MSNIGGMAAFPQGEGSWGNPGMSLRQYYAGLAMQGLLACEGARFVYLRDWIDPERPKLLAKMSTQAADALIEELSK